LFPISILAIAGAVVASQIVLPIPKQPSYVTLIFLGCGLTFCGRYIADGLAVIGTSRHERALIRPRTAGLSGIRALFLRALGIHPIWRWMPSAWRKLLVGVLFALSTLALALAIFLIAIPMWQVLPDQYEKAWAVCLRARTAEEYGYCSGGTVFAPLTFVIILTPIITIAAVCRYAARRIGRLSLEKLIESDKRPPILFLRSFKDDQVRLKKPRRMLWRRLLAAGEPRATLDHILVEEATPHGPVVAIGAPGTSAPFGAARAFVDDDTWQQRVTELARNASAIVIALDDTEGVRWEFENLALAFPAKTLCVLPASFAAPGERRGKIADVLQSSASWSAVADDVRSNPSSCIGWYSREDGSTELLMSIEPSHVSYILAVRSFLLALTARTAAAVRPS
jgi:hypothetical protein